MLHVAAAAAAAACFRRLTTKDELLHLQGLTEELISDKRESAGGLEN